MINVFKVNDKSEVLKAILIIIITEGVGILSSYLAIVDPKVYEALKKPLISPPSSIFPIVWFILYFLMGLAAYRIWELGRQGEDVKKPLKLYVIQLFFNFLWSIIFFRLRLYGVAFVELLILIILILLTTFEFFKQDKLAGLLMIPYIIWTSFAAVLNFAIWYLNS